MANRVNAMARTLTAYSALFVSVVAFGFAMTVKGQRARNNTGRPSSTLMEKNYAVKEVDDSIAMSKSDSIDSRPITLYSIGQASRGLPIVKDVAAQLSKRELLFYVLAQDRRVYAYNSNHILLRSFPTFMDSPDSIAADSAGRIIIADCGASQIRVFGQRGELVRAIVAPHPSSIATLRNGEIVAASVSGETLLHVFDSAGNELRSFGKEKRFLVGNDEENAFLNQGRVVVDASDRIYYVYTHALVPFVQTFSRTGKARSEFILEGKALDLQLSVANRFLRNRRDGVVGGIRIINSAFIDPLTESLWVCLNAASDFGAAYMYNLDGAKTGEYSFNAGSASAASARSNTLTTVNMIVASGPAVYAWAPQGVFNFDLNQQASRRAIHPLDEAASCSVAVDFPECTTPCGTTDKADDKDCKAELLASITLNGQRIVHQNCTTTSTSCSSSVTLCKEANGVESTHSIDLQCGTTGGTGGAGICPPQSCGVGAAFGCFWDPAICDCECSPLLVDILGNGFSLTDVRGGVNFDLKNTGVLTRMAWTSPGSDDAFVVLDRNGNGRVDNGSELFGSFTPQPPAGQPNGFKALAEYDKLENGGNGDSVIDGKDAVFALLRLWQDINHNGISEASELHTLTSLGVYRIRLDYKESRVRDEHGNWFRYRAKILDTPDTPSARAPRWIWDVYLLTER